MAVAITRRDLSATDLRRRAARGRDADAARRMLAIALVLEGRTRTEAAETCGMDRQTLRDWVHRYNDEGLAGLLNRSAPGPAARLSAEQGAELARWVEEGPDLARDGVVRRRCKDLQARIERAFQVRFHERTTPSRARSGPSSTQRASAACCSAESRAAGPGADRFNSPVRPSSL